MTMPSNLPHILVIDDEIQMRRLLQRTLENENYKVFLAENGEVGLTRAGMDRPEVVVLDLGLPDMDGIALLKQLRTWSPVPVLILSVRNAEETVIEALDAGADDYLTKPFRTGELLARIRALLRHRSSSPDDQTLVAGDVVVDLAGRTVTKKNEPVKLTPTEYSLFVLFAKNTGKVLTHTFILQSIWGPSFAEETQYLRVFMGQLRKKLEDDPSNPRMFLTESGVGYRLAAES